MEMVIVVVGVLSLLPMLCNVYQHLNYKKFDVITQQNSEYMFNIINRIVAKHNPGKYDFHGTQIQAPGCAFTIQNVEILVLGQDVITGYKIKTKEKLLKLYCLKCGLKKKFCVECELNEFLSN